MKNILVTGGCGFIGSNFLNQMVKKYPDYNFYNIDCLYYCASLDNIDKEVSESKNYKFIKGNILTFDLVQYIITEYNINMVIHFAAQSHVDNSFSDSIQYTKDNILGTHTLLEACRIHAKSLDLFIHVSTDEVYGESMLDDNEKKKCEKSILCPTNPYAATKAGAEIIAMSYYYSFNMPIIISRGNNVYGPRQYPEKLIPKFIQFLNQDKPVTIQGDGSNKRAFIHVDDVVNAFDIIMHKGNIGEIYNIGSDDHHEYSVMEVTLLLIAKIKDENITKVDDWITFISDRNINDKRYYISNDKLKKLGWKQTINFNDGIDSTIKWYQNIDNTHI